MYRRLLLLFGYLLFIACSSEQNSTLPDNDISDKPDEYYHRDTDTVFDETDNVSDDTDTHSDDSDKQSDDTSDSSELPDADTIPTFDIQGIYSVTGHDEADETYTGKAEIRATTFSHILTYDTKTFESLKVALAYEGSVKSVDSSGATMQFDLAQKGFVVEVNGISRNNMPKDPVRFVGSFTVCGTTTLCGTFTATDGSSASFTEQWHRISSPGEQPLWHNQRAEIDQLPEPSASEKATIKSTFKDFYDREDIKPYEDRPEFQRMVHYMLVDPTDFNYYRTKPQTVRVIQSVISDFSLAEAWMRADAYSLSLSEKERFFSEDIHAISINPLGMISHKIGEIYHQDGDSLIWTGVYVAALAMKYMQTHNETVLQRMIVSLKGIIGCLEITPDPSKDFARTLRMAIDDGNPEFHRGSGSGSVNGIPFSDIEYKEGGNNDMSKGPFIGFLWAYQVLKDKPEYKNLIQQMTEALKRMREHNPIFKDGKTNQTLSDYELGAMMSVLGSGYFDDKLKYETEADSMFAGVKQYFDSDYLVINEYGVSDWSGNHLTLWTLHNYYTVFTLNGRGDKASHMQGVMKRANDLLVYSRTGLFQLMMGGTGNPPNNDSIQDAIWRLREIPMHRGKYKVDWTMNPDFCVSPIPSLPWKNDWHEKGRVQSIRAYLLFEQGSSGYWWKDNILGGYRGGGGANGDSGLDFFIAYWFGRLAGFIQPTD